MLNQMTMSESMTFSSANLPSPQSLQTALRSIERDLPGGMAILKFSKGDWSYGSDNTEPLAGSRWAVNPYSFMHGFIAWHANSPVGEIMAMMHEPLPDPGPAPAESLLPDNEGKPGKGWQRQSGLSLKCLTAPDAGLDVRFTTCSDGGRRAVQQLAVEIAGHIDLDVSHPVAIVEIKVGKYQHRDKARGWIKFPQFDIVDWMSMDGPTSKAALADAPQVPEVPDEAYYEDAPEADAPAADPVATRRRRRA